MLTVLGETVSGQPSTPNDTCICYTDKQDKRCLECLINEPKKDQQINNLQERLYNMDEIHRNDSARISSKENQINGLEVKITGLERKVQANKYKTAIIGGIAGIFGILYILK